MLRRNYFSQVLKAIFIGWILLAAAPLTAHALSTVESITVDPTSPTTETPVTLHIQGYMPTPCHTVSHTYTVSGSQINVDVKITPSGEICIQVIDSWNISIGLGTLQAVQYNVAVNVNSGEDSLAKSFVVKDPQVSTQQFQFKAIANDTSYTVGDNLIIQLDMANDSVEKILDLKLWLETPNLEKMSLISTPSHTILPDETLTLELINHMFTGEEAAGTYTVGARTLNPTTGDYFSTDVITFDFIP